MRVDIREHAMFQSFMRQYYPQYKPVKVKGITIDSRLVQAGDMYIALKGDRVDGHRFISEAESSGAAFIVSEQDAEAGIPLIRVSSTRQFLMEFAQKWWIGFSTPVVGITGSNGKTTTKELLVHVLQPFTSTAWMPGNYNSTIGLPLSLFTMPASSDIAVFEIGSSAPGEIKKLTEIIHPNIGLITNVHPAHIEFFSTLAHLAEEKSELLKNLPGDGVAFINLDDPSISSMDTPAKKITFSFKVSADFCGRWSKNNGSPVLTINEREVTLPIKSETLAKNALAVYSICYTLGINHEDIASQISTFALPEGRGNVIEKNRMRVINDTYNANPESVRAGIEAALSLLPDRRHILVLGDMFELGVHTLEYHRQIGEFIKHNSQIILITYGPLSGVISEICTSHGMECVRRHYPFYQSFPETR